MSAVQMGFTAKGEDSGWCSCLALPLIQYTLCKKHLIITDELHGQGQGQRLLLLFDVTTDSAHIVRKSYLIITDERHCQRQGQRLVLLFGVTTDSVHIVRKSYLIITGELHGRARTAVIAFVWRYH
jgi:hypothetical protein